MSSAAQTEPGSGRRTGPWTYLKRWMGHLTGTSPARAAMLIFGVTIAVFASLLSIVVYELTMSTDLGVDWVVIAMAMGVTLALVGVGALRGSLIRRQARAAGG